MTAPISRFRPRTVLLIVGILAALALGQLILAGLFSAGDATGHARYHAIFALIFLLPAGAAVARWSGPGSASRFLAMGLAAGGAAQLVESVGAFGFDSRNDVRINGFAAVHDFGLLLSGLGMIAALLGLAISIAVVARRRSGAQRWLGLAVAGVAGVGGGLIVKVLIGL